MFRKACREYMCNMNYKFITYPLLVINKGFFQILPHTILLKHTIDCGNKEAFSIAFSILQVIPKQ